MTTEDDVVQRKEFHPDALRLGDVCEIDTASAEPLGEFARIEAGRVNPDAVADPLAWWETLLTAGTRAPAFRLVRSGTTLPRSTLCRAAGIGHERVHDVIEPNRVIDEFQRGASLVLQGLHHTHTPISRLVNNLALELNQPVQANAYITPPTESGLDLHFDFHDVIVVQLSGTKTWTIWDPTDRTRFASKEGPRRAQITPSELAEPRIHTTVRAGDVIVIPRGHAHTATADGEGSAHLTIGVMALTNRSLLRALLADAPAAEHLDRSAPPSPQVARVEFPAAFVAEVHRSEVWRRQPRTRLRPLAHAAEPSHTKRWQFTPGPLVWLTDVDDAVVVHLGDRNVSMPRGARPLLEAILGSDRPISRHSLSEQAGGLDDDEIDVILGALAREGVLRAAH